MKGAALVQTTTVRDEALAILSRLGVPQRIRICRPISMASSMLVTRLMAWRISRRNDCHLAVEL